METLAQKILALTLSDEPDVLRNLLETRPPWEPVDEAAYPDYRPTVRRPLCLGTIAERLDEGWYCSEFEFANDMRLVFLNCQLYNEEHSELWALATDLVSPLTNQFKSSQFN